MLAIGVAPAKVILAGEHFCVYGVPAVSMAISLHAKCTIWRSERKGITISSSIGVSGTFTETGYEPSIGNSNSRREVEPIKIGVEAVAKEFTAISTDIQVFIDSEIPVGVGLGSSAATSVSAIAAFSKLNSLELPKNKISELAYSSESFVHGKPSGIDQTTSTHGGLLLYQIGKGFQQIRPKRPFTLIVGNTLISRSTGEIVAKVKKLWENDRKSTEQLIKAGGEIAKDLARALEQGDLQLAGALMNENQELLRKIGTSHPKLDELIAKARAAGALGAKLTGGGGGGCMISLVTSDVESDVSAAIEEAGGKAFRVFLDQGGVKAWTTT